MRKDVKDMWVTALRSGEYQQGKLSLKTGSGAYCCLGVLACELHKKMPELLTVSGVSYDESPTQITLITGIYAGLENGGLPRDLVIELDFRTNNPNSFFSDLNDNKDWTFDQIADYIEECE